MGADFLTHHPSLRGNLPHRYAVTLRAIWGWMERRPAIRDGTTGYEWHQGPLARCLVHLLRDAEESSMENDLGSP